VTYNLTLLNISYIPIVQTVKVALCGSQAPVTPLVQPNQTTTHSTSNKTATIPTTVATTTVAPLNQKPLTQPNDSGTNGNKLTQTTLASLLGLIIAILAVMLILFARRHHRNR
jgi:hypothetical protein